MTLGHMQQDINWSKCMSSLSMNKMKLEHLMYALHACLM
ncbi:hypothetical protein N646_2208 [Vibrio alginolyticus NBRC 15630 = ATCC 17749]|uniref:Uncharacterized protein n=1 Tax=Vibrio alginolyticus (strain ATCC 17749 / DSM 2171 / NBRC 15630 / NCIMB 1903 / NCTC 12160 / XII-53) TaxID=1219076 RepID=A0A2I3CCW2_VIBAX|nr:hypothetical protein N646_2208 [Vibrio alginolyticus NBRC 15630 = ATCC 17749]